MNTNQSCAGLTPEATIAEITNSNKQAAELLASIGLSLTKHEEETLRSVCEKQQWCEVEVLEWMKNHRAMRNRQQLPVPGEEESLKKWKSYMENSFISPCTAVMEELGEDFPQVYQKHIDEYPWLKEVKEAFLSFSETIKLYHTFQEKKFMPLAIRLDEGRKANISHGIVRQLQRSFSILAKDRDRLQHLMNSLRRQGQQFQNPDDASTLLKMQNKNFKILFGNIEKQFSFEKDQLIPRIKSEIKAKQ
ncbi:hypothetical protein [Fodinibius saliphilus]|uniref:hypothetical protein n=1 Tax=Fodinibius saliphilus TaxID=1920650 RepID=UPI001108D1DD|nr:hypothetical protein [Fodinibius saliphilus]